MKYKIFILAAFVMCASVLAPSCDSWLDRGPEENLSVEEVFRERNYVERWLYNLYSGLPMEMDFHNVLSTSNMFTAGCDEMEVTPGYAWGQYFNRGAVSSSINYFAWSYAAIYSRKCKQLLDNISATYMDEEQKKEWMGEAHFLRAFYNFLALRVYGPIPIHDELMSPGSDYSTVERGTFNECVDFILSDIEEALTLLPVKRTNQYFGRATSAAASALKSRLLLYAASPLYNGNTDYSSMRNSEGKPLIPVEYDASKWRSAAQAAKSCIDLCSNDYALYYSSDRDPVKSCMEIFYKNWNEEVIFALNVGMCQVFEACCDPVSFTGYSIYGPTQQMVDSYRMADGSYPFRTDEDGDVEYSSAGEPSIIPESGYTETGFAAEDGTYWPSGGSNMYVGREPRFYAQVNFSGQNWKGHQFELYYSGSDGLKAGGSYYSATGYVLKKLADPDSKPEGSSPVLPKRSWIYFRLAEIYLNYAEALNECDPGNPDILRYLNAIRVRGGIPELSGSFTQTQMRSLIRQERHVELSFETHRFFDVRRWKTASKTDNGPIYGMDIHSGSYLQDPAFYKRSVVETRRFNSPAMYLFPVYKTEIEKCPSLVQNVGY